MTEQQVQPSSLLMTSEKNENYTALKLVKFIALLCVCAYVIAMLVSAHQPEEISSLTLGSEQVERHHSEVVYIPFIEQKKWSFDFSTAETILRNVRLDDQSQLVIDHETEKQLARILATFPVELSEDDMARIKFLISRAVTNEAGRDFAKLLEQYRYYTKKLSQFEQTLMTEDLALVERLEVMNKACLSIQQEFFAPSIQSQLFYKTNLDNEYFLQRRILLSDSTMSAEQRQQRLAEIASIYRKKLHELELD
ncbi:hypothetical protein EYS14_19545 [Alteromonadaceae bacterium M269]|nr:hypothetical protein EYS14_19545 [Alteromonadaceae bacterium M269]